MFSCFAILYHIITCKVNKTGKQAIYSDFDPVAGWKPKGYLDTSHWDDVTTGEVGSMVREAIKRGEQAISEETRANGKAHQNAE